eukprot:755146-Hanusia_phi.AAC.2
MIIRGRAQAEQCALTRDLQRLVTQPAPRRAQSAAARSRASSLIKHTPHSEAPAQSRVRVISAAAATSRSPPGELVHNWAVHGSFRH